MDRLIIEIYDQKMKMLAQVIDFYSLTWVKRFRDVGEFELTFPYKKELRDALKRNNYVMRSDTDGVMYITEIELSKTNEGYICTIRGRDIIGLIAQRIYADNSYLRGEIKHIVRNMLDASCFRNASADGNVLRAIDNDVNWTADYSTIPGAHNPTSLTEGLLLGFLNCFDIIKMLGEAFGFGINAEFKNGGFFLTFPIQNDRSKTLLFSEKLGNIGAWSTFESDVDYFNNVYVVGSVDGVISNSKPYVNIGGGAGVTRKEIALESSVSKTADISISNYRRMLEQEGIEELSGTALTFKFNIEPTAYAEIEYAIGDIADIETELIDGTGLITEITEIFDSSGYSVFPTLKINTRIPIETEAGDVLTNEDGSKLDAEGIETE